MWKDNASNIDILFFKPYVNTILDLLDNKYNLPETIGLLGSWGSGKSTILNLIKFSNEKKNNIYIKLNAWQFEGYEDSKIAIIEGLFSALQENKLFWNKFKDLFKTIAERINWLKVSKFAFNVGTSWFAKTIGVINPIDPDVFDGILKDNGENNNVIDNIRQFRKDFEEALIKTKIDSLIVGIDDLDRCNPDTILEVLEVIKLFLSVKNTCFIIAVDPEIMNAAVINKYGIKGFDNGNLATNYFEKMIQIPITIPKLSSKDIENYLMLLTLQLYVSEESFNFLITEITKDNVHIKSNPLTIEYLNEIIEQNGIKITKKTEFKKDIEIISKIKQTVSSSLRGNPRQTKRFLNEFYIKKKLASYYFESREINFAILAKIISLNLISTEAFNELYHWNSKFDGEIVELKDITEYSSKGSIDNTIWSKRELIKWLNSEPTDLYKYNLDNYFILTKDKIMNLTDNEINSDVKNALERIYAAKEMAVEGIISSLNNDHKKKQIIEMILKKYSTDYNNLDIVYYIYKHHSNFRKNIENILILVPLGKLDITAVPFLKRMSDTSENKKFVDNLNLDEEIKENIKGKRTK